ncbi:hypothetical protein ACWT_2939 [Actinoplanes sp. SE50]|uniref:phospholipase n=1 Tax=unclassified Actinoplanes TaxID=2626549 RepID=UPI00023EBEEB|nr:MULTISPECIES: phospholipase [unclassified Actinoplanes]AEV83503.1 hypothetical protein ACPL_2608 [Actinoplanes sp. SE50/110]ATO82354.1 hypothetical protein ACWT_2939 [Actinoplanes sp. SE50]SLL99761.1 hypothetical protein ACSP50_2992 [Actinoplanes sp. SE50/110]
MPTAVRSLFAAAVTATAVVAVATPAAAAPADKLSVLSGFTQTSAGSYTSWLAARNNQGAWSDYGFDWSTDYCTTSPDNPLGFDFKLSCARHDFGYRNYKAVGTFDANKDRLDSMLYADLKRKCATYSTLSQAACNSVAWTYYQAVHNFGSLAAVDQADIRSAAALEKS